MLTNRLAAAFPLLLSVTVVAAAQTTTAIPPPPDVAAPPTDAMTTSTGLATRIIKAGSGNVHPSPKDLVTVHYTGWTTDGQMFDSSVARGSAAVVPLDRVIAGWTEGVQLMVAGETRRFWIPESLAYQGKREPGGMLVFDVELISFTESPTHPPPDLEEPPADAQKTESGLAYKVLTPGTGTTHPERTSQVTVHYSGWTTDGRLFDSSVARGTPSTFTLNSVIDGWSEAVQLMVEGEKTRFWIPEDLAYKGESAPYGMLIFDVELIRVE